MVIGLYKQGKINELITRPMVQSFARALSSLTEKFYKPERFLEGFQTVNMCDSEICTKTFEKYRIAMDVREEEKKNILKLLFNLRKG